MTGYHDEKTLRERLAKPLYKIPISDNPSHLRILFERFLAGILIPFIEGDNPRWKHFGKDCPCMTE